jgi:TonB family protein
MNKTTIALFISLSLHFVLLITLNIKTAKNSHPLFKIEVSASTNSEKKANEKQKKKMNGISPTDKNSNDSQLRNDIISELNANLQNQMAYPPAAVKLGYEGKVTIQAIIESQRALEIQITNSSGHKLLDDQVFNTLNRWQFPTSFSGPISLTFEFYLN